MVKNHSPSIILTAMGVAQKKGKSEAWARLAFKTGTIPTEFLIEGKRPAITEATLDRLQISRS